MRNKLVSLTGIILPVSPAPVFFAVVAGNPPMSIAWLIALVPWLLYISLKRSLFSRTPFDIPIMIFCLGLIIGFVVSPNREVGSEALLTTFGSILIYYGLVNNAEKGSAYWLAMLGAGSSFILLLIVWFFSQGEARLMFFNEWLFKLEAVLPKTKGPVLQFNNIGVFLALITPIFFSGFLFSKGRKRWLLLGAGILLLAAIFLSASGSGWGAIICGMIFVFAVWRGKTIFVTIPATGVGAAVIAANYSNFDWPAKIFSNESLAGRIDLWLKVIPQISEHWFTGIGLGSWSELFGGSINAHNSYIQLYADAGLLGIVAFLLAFGTLLRQSSRGILARQQTAWYGVFVGTTGGFVAGAAASVFEVITYGAFQTPAHHYMSIPLLWIIMALFVVSFRHLVFGTHSISNDDLP